MGHSESLIYLLKELVTISLSINNSLPRRLPIPPFRLPTATRQVVSIYVAPHCRMPCSRTAGEQRATCDDMRSIFFFFNFLSPSRFLRAARNPLDRIIIKKKKNKSEIPSPLGGVTTPTLNVLVVHCIVILGPITSCIMLSARLYFSKPPWSQR